ncbi:MAG: cytochrome C biosynthesis protein [Deltaproteobacteria bacterium CG_4_10_14_3_um_filter_60_8]|nr:MAG: cytochrome C biosynthesis protein [Desulfobacterales bacterium CG2_30_60_27]PIP44637.1 MAG: cytochrome C biosynthesis protein [Deltaproteobacteria bacterium CG23_combo_of_CG06-09_8_20_14_all_60_8]PIY21099.1 MAG: cytochrome C biosynthesis protein [Deltaproteobacteria bacterium CG_4_10_14_3_um_filter_60_8]
MLDQFYLMVNAWMVGATGLAMLGCFLWGMLSVLFSPCHLASIPLIIAYVAGQKQVVQGRQAAIFAVLFSLGLFATIAIIGVICAMLGRMLGDVGPYLTMVVGVILLWVGLDMLGVAKCKLPGNQLLGKITLKGAAGAFVLGLAYGVLSGSCTFGFIAPILAIITVQEKFMTGVLLISLFAMGHCLPIAVAGSSTALIRRLLENHAMRQGGQWFRRAAGVLIAGLGLYFIARPFV